MGSEPYTKTNIKEFEKRRKRLRELKITLDEKITYEKKLRGIYGFFAVDPDGSESCFYIGKSYDIFDRLIGRSGGHLTDYLRIADPMKKTEVHKNIDMFRKAGYDIKVKVLRTVPYVHSEPFAVNANRLCMAELEELVKYQKKGECPEELSENVKTSEKRSAFIACQLIDHIKLFGYWEKCEVLCKDLLYSDSDPCIRKNYPGAKRVGRCRDSYIFRLKDETPDALTLKLYGRMGGLLYIDMCNLSAYARAYMKASYDRYEIKAFNIADGSVAAYRALEEFLDKIGLEITSKDVSGESDSCTYHINYKKIK